MCVCVGVCVRACVRARACVLWIVLGEAPVSPVTILVWFVGYLRGSSSNYRRCIWLAFSKRISIDFRATLEVPCLYFSRLH